jgi:hypothetical protein
VPLRRLGVPLRSCGDQFPRIAARFFTFWCAYPQSTRLIDRCQMPCGKVFGI